MTQSLPQRQRVPSLRLLAPALLALPVKTTDRPAGENRSYNELVADGSYCNASIEEAFVPRVNSFLIRLWADHYRRVHLMDTGVEVSIASELQKMFSLDENFHPGSFEQFHSRWEFVRRLLFSSFDDSSSPPKIISLGAFYGNHLTAAAAIKETPLVINAGKAQLIEFQDTIAQLCRDKKWPFARVEDMDNCFLHFGGTQPGFDALVVHPLASNQPNPEFVS